MQESFPLSRSPAGLLCECGKTRDSAENRSARTAASQPFCMPLYHWLSEHKGCVKRLRISRPTELPVSLVALQICQAIYTTPSLSLPARMILADQMIQSSSCAHHLNRRVIWSQRCLSSILPAQGMPNLICRYSRLTSGKLALKARDRQFIREALLQAPSLWTACSVHLVQLWLSLNTGIQLWLLKIQRPFFSKSAKSASGLSVLHKRNKGVGRAFLW